MNVTSIVTSTHESIDVGLLRVGMFVHLEGGWMAHPFAVSNFRIAAQAQIETIAGLGVKQVRWSRHKSVLEAPTAPPGPADPAAAPVAPGLTSKLIGAPVPLSRPDSRSDAQREAARADRAAQRVCERQFAEAARECRQLTARVPGQPLQAGASALALLRTLTQKMIGSAELCVRLLGEAAGDQASVHAMNVAVLSLLLGRVCGLDEPEMLDLGVGALLHDIGKLDLAESQRHPDPAFTPGELRAYQDHVAHGVAQARRMALSDGATLVIAQHHEHADGSGFPRGLTSERQGAASRIVSLVNRYDNLCNPHLAAAAVTPHEALALLFANGRATFDDAVLGAFIRMLGIYPPGSTVQLTDDRHALVVGANSTRPLRPRVRVHDPRAAPDGVLLVDLETTSGLGIRRSLKPGQLPAKAIDALMPRARVVYFFEPAAAPSRASECGECTA